METLFPCHLVYFLTFLICIRVSGTETFCPCICLLLLVSDVRSYVRLLGHRCRYVRFPPLPEAFHRTAGRQRQARKGPVIGQRKVHQQQWRERIEGAWDGPGAWCGRTSSVVGLPLRPAARLAGPPRRSLAWSRRRSGSRAGPPNAAHHPPAARSAAPLHDDPPPPRSPGRSAAWSLRYLKYHDLHGGDQESRKSNYTDLVNKYYNLATGFYEHGWGDSFHFAGRYLGETSREAIKRHQHFMALQLGLKKGMKVLDVGCGIGGPLIEIARFSSALITGLNYNDYQISRGKELVFSAGLSEQCCFLKGDFMNMPIADNTFDAAYAIQATCHAPDAQGVYSEIYRVLKPGQYFALDEWCLTDRFDPNNAKHLAVKAEIELGDGLPDIRTTCQCVQAMKDAGFEVIFAKDLAQDFQCPWYRTMDPNNFSWTTFQCTRPGRIITRAIVNALEFLRIAPAGSAGIYDFLMSASDGLLKGGREGIFTATFVVLGRKPFKETEIVNNGNL